MPPALAARLRFVLLALLLERLLLDVDLRVLLPLLDDLRALLADVDLRALEPDPLSRPLDARLLDALPRELEPLEPELELRLREPDPEPEPDDFREDDDFRPEPRDDDPPRLPLPDSAIALLL